MRERGGENWVCGTGSKFGKHAGPTPSEYNMRVNKTIYCRRTGGPSRTVRYFYTKKPLMKTFFSASSLRLALLLALGAGTATVLTTACKKDPEPVVFKDYSGIDDDIIKKYIADSTVTGAQKQPSGLYYVPVLTDPNAVRATMGKTVAVLYTGRLMNGTVFDASANHGNTPYSFVLGNHTVIDGWDIGIALMHKGDKGVLLIPSALGYGPYGSGSIPPNAVIRFEVELVEVR